MYAVPAKSRTFTTGTSLANCLRTCSSVLSSASTTTVMRENSAFSVRPTTSESMLKPRAANIPATFAKTPGSLITSAEITCRMKSPSEFQHIMRFVFSHKMYRLASPRRGGCGYARNFARSCGAALNNCGYHLIFMLQPPPPFSISIFLMLMSIFAASSITFLFLVRRWTTQRQWVSLGEWARQRKFSRRPQNAPALAAMKSLLNSEFEVVLRLSRADVLLMQIQTPPPPGMQMSSRWNVLMRKRVKASVRPRRCVRLPRPRVFSIYLVFQIFLPSQSARASLCWRQARPRAKFVRFGVANAFACEYWFAALGGLADVGFFEPAVRSD